MYILETTSWNWASLASHWWTVLCHVYQNKVSWFRQCWYPQPYLSAWKLQSTLQVPVEPYSRPICQISIISKIKITYDNIELVLPQRIRDQRIVNISSFCWNWASLASHWWTVLCHVYQNKVSWFRQCWYPQPYLSAWKLQSTLQVPVEPYSRPICQISIISKIKITYDNIELVLPQRIRDQRIVNISSFWLIKPAIW